jgi:16S rRNA (cytidine1402-2'-O)-methyltransferase
MSNFKSTKDVNRIFYLIPNMLSENNAVDNYPFENIKILEKAEVIIAETAKECRRFLKLINVSKPISDFNIVEMPKQKHHQMGEDEIQLLWKEYSLIGFVSDAGLPCIADPGAELVNQARAHGFLIQPMVGASSLMMALMASGMNGQEFCFNGYLPVDISELKIKIKLMENMVNKFGITQLFIETPYRNDKMLDMLLAELQPETRLSVSVNIGGGDEWNRTDKVVLWKKAIRYPGKQPAVFLIGK